jgi:hypothetical protein
MGVSVSEHGRAAGGAGGPTTAEARGRVLAWLDLLGSAEAQLGYQRSAPVADVSAELYCVWFDDLEACFTEAHFSDEELARLRWFTRQMDEVGDSLGQRLPPIEELVALPAWQRVVALAAETAAAVRGGGPATTH